MTRALNRSTNILLASSALCFALSLYVFGDWNNRPVALPMPAPGLQVAAPFNVATSGAFQLRITIPMTQNVSAGLPVQAPIFACLRMTINGPDGFKKEESIKYLHSSGHYEYGKLDFFESAPVSLPSRGDYDLRLQNCDSPSAAYHYGAMVEFIRKGNPTDAIWQSFSYGALRGSCSL
jgi:hypothetical protein